MSANNLYLTNKKYQRRFEDEDDVDDVVEENNVEEVNSDVHVQDNMTQLSKSNDIWENRENEITKSNPRLHLMVGKDAHNSKFKLNIAMKKLQPLFPVISGYTLEHYYRFNKPPFMNFGHIRNVKLARY
ncbi:hypothetical protein PGB90_006741 [Kerria lacca]